MDADALIVIGVGAAAVWLLMRQTGQAPPIDQSVMDPRDAWARYQAPAAESVEWEQSDDMPFYDMGAPQDSLYEENPAPLDDYALDDYKSAPDLSTVEYDDGSATSYDPMGNVTTVNYRSDAMVGSGWSESIIPAQYLATIRNAEQANGLPYNLLARLLYQESHFRQEIISGQVRSSVGAMGIAQFMPERISGVSSAVALDPHQAIPAAASMLARLYRRFGEWGAALAAYNWGEGNVNSWVRTGLGAKGQVMPKETRNYFSQVLADIGMPPTTA